MTYAMWRVFEADSANQLWTRVVEALSSRDDVIEQPSRAGLTRELLHTALTLRNPRSRWVTVRRPAINPAFALAEVFWILAGRRDSQFVRYFNRSLSRHAGRADLFHGAYGYRLREHFQVDQLERAFQVLRANPNSRQVVLQIWDPRIDLPTSDGQPRDPDIPCNTQSLLKIRSGKLEWVQVMRSNDVFLGLPHNLIQFTMLHEILAGWLEVGLGEYHHLSDSMHLYARDVTLIGSDDSNSSNADVFALPWSESVKAIATVTRIIEQIIDEKFSVHHVERLPVYAELPAAYRNAAFVMAAEGIRRRGDQARASAMISSLCTSQLFRQLWENWCNRLHAQL